MPQKIDSGKTIQEKATVLYDVANSLSSLYKPHEYGLVQLKDDGRIGKGFRGNCKTLCVSVLRRARRARPTVARPNWQGVRAAHAD